MKCTSMISWMEQTTFADVIELQRQLITLLQTGGFEVHKWCSNRSEVLIHLPQERIEDLSTRNINANDVIKTLGIE